MSAALLLSAVRSVQRINAGFRRSIRAIPTIVCSRSHLTTLLNVRSLRNKGDFIIDYVHENDFDIFCLTKTWLTDTCLTEALIPHGYGFHHLPRNDRRGGGVGVLV